ncbi:methyltransferase domain-containing protein [Couchioplanes caeruleus]|uniref:class I SAM-dependent methyltransferase n=1 Tax=Couchioplanes caeruleus TaxID=56438 RepID=UPI00201B9E8A|nr:class I SAM-dependent methyltransferase [Couchioplanes caeruleus]UQU63928.1 methyltransferase domain-containing protein [Couchioplanes caeruleus]
MTGVDWTEPAWRAVLERSGTGTGARVLDVGCGCGGFLAYCAGRGMVASGIDPDGDLVAVACGEGLDVRTGEAEKVPWDDATFDLTTAFNALQFAEDTDEALAEMVRVTRPGGHVAVANWAERALNDVDAIERALADGPPGPEGDLRLPGGLRGLLEDGGLTAVHEGLVDVPWEFADDDSLVSWIVGDGAPEVAVKVLAAVRPYRQNAEGYRLINRFRYAVGRRSPAVGR